MGAETTLVALGISAYSIIGVAARLITAFILDKVEPARVMALCCVIVAVGCLVTGLIPSASPFIIFLFYLAIGIGFMVCLVVMPTAYANYFGHTNFPKIIGTMLPILAIIASLVPTIAGIYFDAAGNYSGVFIGVGVYAVVGAILASCIRFPKSNDV
jgi:MFS family permease